MMSAGKFNRQAARAVSGGERLFTVKEVAGQLRIASDTVYRLINQQELEAVKVAGPRSLRVPESALEAYLTRRLAQ